MKPFSDAYTSTCIHMRAHMHLLPATAAGSLGCVEPGAGPLAFSWGKPKLLLCIMSGSTGVLGEPKPVVHGRGETNPKSVKPSQLADALSSQFSSFLGS